MGDGDEPEMEAVYAEFADDEMRSIFGDGATMKQFIELVMPSPLRRFLRRVERGEAQPWHAERPLYETKLAMERAGQALSDEERQDAGRLMVRMMIHPRFPDYAERTYRALSLRADRRAREDVEARRIVGWTLEVVKAHPAHAAAIIDASWDLDKGQRDGVTKLWNALEPLDGADEIEEHLAVRRVLNTFHQVAELGYRPYASALFKMARAYDPSIPQREKFGGFVSVLHEHLDQKWPKFAAIIDPEVVFIRNAAAHPELETLFDVRKYRLRDNPGGGRSPTVRDYTFKALQKRAKGLIALTMPDGHIQRAAECVRLRAFVNNGLQPEIAKWREAVEAHRDELTRYAAGEDVPGIFTPAS